MESGNASFENENLTKLKDNKELKEYSKPFIIKNYQMKNT